MLRAEAIRRLKKLYGAKAWWSVKEEISSPENRATAGEACRALKSQEEELSRQMDVVRKRLLEDPEYRSLLAAWKVVKNERAKLSGRQLFYRFEAGYVSGVGGISFAHVEAHGDTWEELFAELEKKRGDNGSKAGK